MGEKNVESILYSLLNPLHAQARDREAKIKLDLTKFLKRFMEDEDEDVHEYLIKRSIYTRYYPRVILSWNYSEGMRRARERAWKELLEKLKRGEVEPSEISLQQLVEYFHEELLLALEEEGYVRREKVSRSLSHFMNILLFTPKGERLLAEKILEEAFKEMKVSSVGPHESEKEGLGLAPSSMIVDYDEYKHTYDMLDITETMVNAALKHPADLDLTEDVLKAREPLHMCRASNVILIDKSGSMSMNYRMVGAIEAALSLRRLLEEEYIDDKLWIVAYDHCVHPMDVGDLANLWPYGWTDIGQALDYARELLSREDGVKNVFLITDGQPTASSRLYQTPIESALKASERLKDDNVRLNIILLDCGSPNFRSICEKMAELAGDANIAFVENPLDLKCFMLKSYRELRE